VLCCNITSIRSRYPWEFEKTTAVNKWLNETNENHHGNESAFTARVRLYAGESAFTTPSPP